MSRMADVRAALALAAAHLLDSLRAKYCVEGKQVKIPRKHCEVALKGQSLFSPHYVHVSVMYIFNYDLISFTAGCLTRTFRML